MADGQNPDPYAAFGGSITQQPQQQAADPYAAFGGSVAKPATTPAPTQPAPQSWWDRLRTSAGSQTPEQVAAEQRPLGEAKGIGQSVVSTATGLGGLINKYAHTSIEDPNITRRALEWSKPKTDQEREGFLAGNLGQIFAGGGPFEDLLQSLPMAERLGEVVKTVKAMGGDTVMGRLLRVGMSAVSDASSTAARGAAEVGGQTYAQTGGDVRAATQAAIPAAAGGFILAGIPGAGRQAGRELADWAEAQRAGTQVIAGVPFETRPGTQIRPGQPQLLLRNLTEVTQDPASQAVDAASGNIGRTAAARSIKAANDARAPEAAIIPPSRQLPGTAGYTVQGTPAVETVTQPSQEGSRIYGLTREVPNPNYTPVGTEPRGTPTDAELRRQAVETQAVPTRSITGEPTVTVPNWQEIPPTGGGDVTRGGGGPVILTADGQGSTIARARQQLSQYERILSDPAQVQEMGPQEAARIQQAHADLNEQIRRYDDFAASQPHFAPIDPNDVVANTDSLGDAATHLKAQGGQFWTTADETARAAGDSETWTGLRNEEKNIKARMNSTTPSARWDDLRAELADVHQRQFAFMDRYRTSFSPQEWEYHRQLYQDGAVLDDLHSLIESKFNGITQAEAARRGLQRVFEPTKNFTNELENFYSGGYRGSATNRDVLERTIGQPHMDDLKQLGQLWTNSERMEASNKLINSIGVAIRRHYLGLRGLLMEAPAGFALGAYAAGHLGGGIIPMMGAPAVGGTITGTRRYLMDRLATDPDFMRRFVYAVQNNVSPRTGGAVLAARLIGASQEPQARVEQPAAPAAAPAATPVPAPAEQPQRLRAQTPPNSISFTYQGAQFYRDASGNFYDSQGSPLQSQYMTTDQQAAMDRAANAQTGRR